MTPDTAVHLCLLAVSAVLVIAAWRDVRDLIIPNYVSLALVALYPFYLGITPMPVDWQASLIGAAIVLVLGFAAFARGWLGGGDAKLLAATALWFEPHLLIAFLFKTALIGMTMSILVLAKVHVGIAYAAERLGAPRLRLMLLRDELPYGVAIAGGALFTLWRGATLTF